MRFATAINFIQYYAFSRKPHVSFDFLTAIRMYNMYSLSVCLYFRSHLTLYSTHSIISLLLLLLRSLNNNKIKIVCRMKKKNHEKA